MTPDIAAALAARLGRWAEGNNIPVAWENVEFTPPATGIYLAAYDMPATPQTMDLGLSCQIYSGVYQVNIVTPTGNGRTEAISLARQVAELFPEGADIRGDGFTCWISGPPAIFRGISTAVSYTVPVSVNYQADIVS